MQEALEYIDKLYEASVESGVPVGHSLCDRRVLYPRSAIPGRLALYGHAVTVEDLDTQAEAGWFAWLPGAFGDNGEEVGTPLYVVDRIELFLQLRAKGWQDDELKDYAKYEDWFVDVCLLDDDWDYNDDDIVIVVRRLSDELNTLQQEQVRRKPPAKRPDGWMLKSWSSEMANLSDAELQSKVDQWDRIISRLSGRNVDDLPERTRAAVKKEAFRNRAWQDMVRAMMLSNERAPLIAGYSRAVQLEPPDGMRPILIDPADPEAFGRVNWAATVHDHYVMERFDEAVVRLPRFILQGDRITQERLLLPAEYERLFRQYDLQEYLNVRAVIRGERRCAHCSASLPAEASPSRRYCDDKCSQAARQKAYRHRKKREVLR